MTKFIKNKTELAAFRIGFEFEFYVSNKAMFSDEPKKTNKKIPKDILEKYGHLFSVKEQKNNITLSYEEAGQYFLDKMKEYYPETNWKRLFSIEDDGSLTSTDKITSVEMVYKHTPAQESMINLHKIISVLNLPEFSTLSDCGLHVNISFTDVKFNKKYLAFDICRVLDIDKILTNFSRKDNDNCVSNKETEIDKEGLLEDFSEKLFEYLNKLDKKRKNSYNDYIDYDNFQSFTKSLMNASSLKAFMKMVEDSAKEKFLENWEDDRPAVAPKTNESNKNYLEFRLMGGKNYQQKFDLIESGISDYLKAMKNIKLQYQKDIVFAQSLSDNLSKNKIGKF